MKKPSSKIREEIAKLHQQLKQAETREAERLGRVAVRAGLGEVEIDDEEIQAAFEDVAKRLCGGKGEPNPQERTRPHLSGTSQSPPVASGAAQGSTGEA